MVGFLGHNQDENGKVRDKRREVWEGTYPNNVQMLDIFPLLLRDGFGRDEFLEQSRLIFSGNVHTLKLAFPPHTIRALIP